MRVLLHNKTTKQNKFFNHLKAFEFNTKGLDLKDYVVLRGESKINKFLKQSTKAEIPENEYARVEVKLPHMLVEQLRSSAKERGVSFSKIVELILEDYVQ
jgi:predicted DNA binding CopG/RHH family protein